LLVIARALALVGLIAAALVGSVALRAGAPRAAAPPLEIRCSDGSSFDLNGFAGRPVLVEFFAVWCPECRRDVPRLDEIARRLRDRIEIIAIAVEGTPPGVEAAVREVGGRYRVGVTGKDTARAWGVARFPTRFLVDPSGRIACRDASIQDILREVDP